MDDNFAEEVKAEADRNSRGYCDVSAREIKEVMYALAMAGYGVVKIYNKID